MFYYYIGTMILWDNVLLLHRNDDYCGIMFYYYIGMMILWDNVLLLHRNDDPVG